VRVHTKRGWVVLASDAMHFFANAETGSPFPVVVNVNDYLAAQALLPSLAESAAHVIPGHDPKVMGMYPAVAEGIIRLDVPPL
jgi:hypothetical protein